MQSSTRMAEHESGSMGLNSGVLKCSLLTVQVLHLDPIPYGAQVIAQVECASRLNSREDSLPAKCTEIFQAIPIFTCGDRKRE